MSTRRVKILEFISILSLVLFLVSQIYIAGQAKGFYEGVFDSCMVIRRYQISTARTYSVDDFRNTLGECDTFAVSAEGVGAFERRLPWR